MVSTDTRLGLGADATRPLGLTVTLTLPDALITTGMTGQQIPILCDL